MRIFVAGATGTLGRPVVRLLMSHGHEVTGLTRSPARARDLAALGVHGVVGNALDAAALNALVGAARPDRVVHLLTALPPAGPMRRRHLAPTNRLRVVGTANLIRAAVAAKARRLVAESFVAVYGPAARNGAIAEDEPLPAVEAGALKEAVAALRIMEEQLRNARSTGQLMVTILRIGFLYGSDVPATQNLVRLARAGRLLMPRDMNGVAPFVHVEDAASAVVAAIEQPDPSPVYNVADDAPVTLSTFVAKLTAAVGAPPPRHVPGWIVKLVAPLMAELGAMRLAMSNQRIKRELDWALRYPTIDSGLTEVAQAAAPSHRT